jgi:predicted transcriptional regulator
MSGLTVAGLSAKIFLQAVARRPFCTSERQRRNMMTGIEIKAAMKSLRISRDAVNCYDALGKGPAYSHELEARGLCQGDRVTILQALQELSKRGLIDRAEEQEGRWIRK